MPLRVGLEKGTLKSWAPVGSCRICGTLDELLQNRNPWIHEYFHGPRARAADKDAHG